MFIKHKTLIEEINNEGFRGNRRGQIINALQWLESVQSNGLIKWFTVRNGTLPNHLYAAHVTCDTLQYL